MKYPAIKLVDVVLCAAAIAILVFITVNRSSKKHIEMPQRIEITVSPQYGHLFGNDIMNALILEFEEQNPKLRILAEGPVAEGESDVIVFDDGEFISLVNASALSSLSPYLEAGNQGEHLALKETPVTLWALPLMSFIDLFFYNIDILEAANSDRPPKTRAEFLTAARSVAGRSPAASGKGPVYPFALGLSQADPLALRRDIYPWLWMDGGDLQSIAAAGTALPRVFTYTMGFFGQLNRENLLAPGTFEKNGKARLQEFAEGKIAMMAGSARDIAFLRRNAQGVNFGITAIPATAQGKNRLGLSGIYAGISSTCANTDEAWAFLSFIAGKSQTLAQALNAVPGSSPGAFPGEYITQDPLYSKAWEIFEAADIVEYNLGQLSSEREIDRIIREKLMEVFH